MALSNNEDESWLAENGELGAEDKDRAEFEVVADVMPELRV